MRVSRVFVGNRVYEGPWTGEDEAVASLFSDQLRGWREKPGSNRIRKFSIAGRSQSISILLSLSVERIPINVAKG